MEFKNGIALTGGISSGKSTAKRYIEKKGYKVIDADKIAHKILDSKREEIRLFFGKKYINEDGTVNRIELGKRVFKKETELKALEGIVKEDIRNEIIREAKEEEKKCKPYFIDIPLFFENEDKYPFKKSILIDIEPEIQIKRLMERNNLTEKEANDRISKQMSRNEKLDKSFWVIENNGSIEDFKISIDCILTFLKIS
jgi:dephospho-CoA kinase